MKDTAYNNNGTVKGLFTHTINITVFVSGTLDLFDVTCNGLFTLPDPDSDSDSDSDSKPYGYIVLFRTFHIDSDPDPDPIPLVFV